MFCDYLGPFKVKLNGTTKKVYVLCFTCLWSRHINLKVCEDLSVENFIRSFQLHCFEYGVPETCHSDMGSQIVAASNVISDFIKDEETTKYFRELGMSSPTFTQVPKGNKELAGLIEICVKMVKRLLYGSIGKVILSYSDLEFLVYHCTHIINRRPVAFKESLRDTANTPCPITPEMITKGYELPSVNLIPNLQQTPIDPDWYQQLDAGNITD